MKTLLFLCVLCVPCFMVSGQESIKSGMPVKAIPYPYTLLENPKEFKVLSDNAIVMTAGKETDLHNPANGSYFRHTAPKFLFTPDANFVFSARVKPSFENQYDGGAILLYSDSENWAKVLLQYIDKKPILGISVIKDKITDDAYFIPEGKEVFLRLTKVGKVFNFLTSPDGKEWTLIREFVYHKPEHLKIGFYSQSPIGNSCRVEFSDITYSGTKER
jgi:regulation of enolase protein 1 (concanavalin A-like superfamily)